MPLKTLHISLVTALCLTAHSVTAQAENFGPIPRSTLPENCFPSRAILLQELEKKHSETPVAFGVTNAGGLMELVKSVPGAEESTWTLIITAPQGWSCWLAAGEGWRDIEQIALDPEA